MKMLCNSSLVNAFMALVSLLAASSSGRALRLSRPYMLARQSRGFAHYAVEASPWQQLDCMQYKLPAQSNRDGRFWPLAAVSPRSHQHGSYRRCCGPNVVLGGG